MWFLIRWLLTPVKLFVGYDAFTAYARADGMAYVDALTERVGSQVAPRSDLHEAAPGKSMPPTLFLALALSRVLVIAVTPGSARSPYVDAEVRWFLRLSGGPVLPVEVSEKASNATWWPRIAGVPPVAPEQDVFRIRQCIGFWGRSRRLAVGLAVLGMALGRDGVATYARPLLAVRSWKVAPNGPALGVISEELSRYSRPTIGWHTGVRPPMQLVLSRSGRFIAVADRKRIEVWSREGRFVGDMAVLDSQSPVEIALTGEPGDLIVAAGGRVCRGRADLWTTAQCRVLAEAGTSMVSADGEWVAVRRAHDTLLAGTAPGGEQRVLAGVPLCFAGDRLFVSLPSAQSGHRSIVDHPLRTDGYGLGPTETDLPPGDVVHCRPFEIVYSAAPADGLISVWGAVRVPIPVSVGGAKVVLGGTGELAAVSSFHGQLWRNGPRGWEFAMHLPGGEAVAMNGAEVVTIDEDGFLTLSSTADFRLLAKWNARDEAPALAKRFTGRWDTVNARDGGVEALVGAPKPYRSANGRWELQVGETEIEVVQVADSSVVLRLPYGAETISAAFSPDSDAVAVELADRVEIWSLDTERYALELCERIGDYSSTESASSWSAAAFTAACGLEVHQNWFLKEEG